MSKAVYEQLNRRLELRQRKIEELQAEIERKQREKNEVIATLSRVQQRERHALQAVEMWREDYNKLRHEMAAQNELVARLDGAAQYWKEQAGSA